MCDKDCGVFVAMDKLVKLHPKATENMPLKIGDRVIAYDNQDEPVKGKVKWVGENNGKPIVGIYTVSTHIKQFA